MAIFRCKMCGGDLEIIENSSSCTCDFCGTQQTIPTVKDENLQGLFNRANVLRMKSEFDKAEEIYEKILQASETEAEAYWGLILCKYGIEYVEDPATYKRIPTCHRASYESITADEDYKSALKYADIQQRRIYEAEAKEIEEVQKGIMALVANEKPYDVFICYKETDESGRRTQDSVIANDIYYQLIQEGFKVFYAAITLEDKLGSEYEPYIFSALNTAKVMLSLGTKPEYFNAVWVKNEWSRFLKIMKKDRSKMLIPCYRDMDAYELPEEFAHLQAQDMSKIGFINDIVRGIKKVVVKEEANQQVVQQTVIQQAAPVNSNIQALLDRGNMAIEDGEWEKADGFFEEVLNQDAKCAEAYLGKLLAREHRKSFDSYVSGLCYKYSDTSSEKLEACPENSGVISDAVKKYALDKYVTEKEITNLFVYDRTYSSTLSNRKYQKDKQLREIDDDKLLGRLKLYMSGDLADKVKSGLAKVEKELDDRIIEAKKSDEVAIAQVKAAYATHLGNAMALAKEVYDNACEKKDADYQEIVAKISDAQTVDDFQSIIGEIDGFGPYRDLAVKKKFCKSEIDRINEAERLEEEEKQRQAEIKQRQAEIAAAKMKKTIIVSAAAIAAIVVMVFIVSAIIKICKYNTAQLALSEGRYEDAVKGFAELEDYKDSKEKKTESIYQYANWLFENKEYEKAVKEYEKLGDYKESLNQLTISALKSGVEGISGVYVEFANNKWLVLESKDGKAFLLSKEVIGERPYNVEYDSITWEKCTLRKWLNSDYLNSAFDEKERKAIVETKVVNADEPKYGTAGGKDTEDKIFLLSIDEVNKYFDTDMERIALDAEGDTAWWWLRSPGFYSKYAAYVYSEGFVLDYGIHVDIGSGAVRPALWVDVSNL